MVLKSSKSGVYSGNTLRASNSRYNRLYRTHGCIVRRYVKSAEQRNRRIKTLIDNFDLRSYDVEYSLNKKERWGLPDFIRKQIQDNKITDEVNKTDLVVRHKLKRQANCIAYYANKGLLKRLVPRGGRYIDGKGATNFKTKPKKTGNRRDAENDEEIDPVLLMDTVRYEIFLPCSRFSSLVHNPKYIKPAEVEDEESTTFGGGRKKKKRTRLTSRDIDELLEFSDPRNDDVLDIDTPCEDSDVKGDRPTGNFTLRDFLKPECKSKRRSQRRHSHASDDNECKKKRVVYVEENSEEKPNFVRSKSTEDVTVSSLKDPTTMSPVPVQLDRDEIAFDSLQTRYGTRYLEARCEPRKFSIDITDRVREHVKSSRQFRDITTSSLDLFCYLNFTEIGASPDHPNLEVCDVGLNFSSHMNTIRLENVLEMTTYTISELEVKVMCYIDMLPRDLFVKSDISDRLNEPLMKFELVNKAKKWNVNCIHPQEVSNIAVMAPSVAEDVNCEFPSEFCNICYDEIRTDSDMGDVRAAATCLNACGHWFCDRCWRDHLISKLRSGAPQFTCPEYECKSSVDFATLLSFLHIGDIQKHIARQESEKINRSDQAMWCPIPNCGRAILAEAADENTLAPDRLGVVCKCGADLCFTCMKNAHWPATCDQAKGFREKVIALNDFAVFPKFTFIDPLPDALIVKGKSCPACHRFIEKISGCPSMTCACGATFCWTCVQLIKLYSPHHCVAENLREMAVAGDVLNRYDTGLRRTRFYTTALEHRIERMYPKFYKYRSRAFAISKRLAVTAAKDPIIQHQISKLQESDDRSLQSQVCKFMMRILGIKLELHHVIEHVAVAMDNMPYNSLRIKLQDSLTHMESYVWNIGSILERGAVQDLRTVLPQLQNVQRNAQRSVSHLSRTMGTGKHA